MRDGFDSTSWANTYAGYPYLPGSSLKGALRAKAKAAPDLLAVFGPDTGDEGKSSGSAVFGDANLLFLPMKTAKGLFAYVTSDYIVKRFLRDARMAASRARNVTEKPGVTVTAGDKVSFEDVGDVAVTSGESLKEVLGHMPQKLEKEVLGRAVCVGEDTFRLLLEQGLDLVTRVRINPDTNTADPGGLWLEENLPVETILVSVIGALRDARKVTELITELAAGVTYLGGHVTVGRGRTQLHLGGTA